MPEPLRLLRQTGWGDLLLLGPFAIPVVSARLIDLLVWLNEYLGLPGAAETNALLYMLANVMGIFAVSSAVMRLRRPSVDWVYATVLVKFGAAGIILLAISQQAPAILAVVAGADLLTATRLLISVTRHRWRPRPDPGPG
ncbi:MAG: hypothetical protein EPO25_16755 [Gammaproteobacteria bacterium]|nr:MAG: hypothetical protein EPO25_16755 [Gammaproteobacteria bacterium]